MLLKRKVIIFYYIYGSTDIHPPSFFSLTSSSNQMIASEYKTSEFQVVIAIDFDDGRLFPLTENLPQCLLPIGNEKILRLQLNALEKFGATGKS